MQRRKEVNDIFNSFSIRVFDRSINDPACVTCGSTKIQQSDFRDPLSWKEFSISHMCQACQDKVFTEE